ncbi:legume-like lectin family-domain-containing protein [Gautieria morchelliformis]|nr:legume-like lectin family-domain-containing protein [Gautieria morchelliformis]
MVSLRRLLKYAFILLPSSLAVQGKKQPQELPKRDIERVVQLRTHSLFAPYIDQDLQNRWWDFGADAYINTNKHIRLTRSVPSQMGWLWSRLAVTAQHFEIEVEFKISGEQSHLYGDGLALWLTTERAQPGPVFGSMDKFHGLGVFIDTYANSRHNYSFPNIMAMLGDGQTSYDQGEDGEPNSVASCAASVRRTHVPTKLKLTYIEAESLDVKVQYKSWNEWTDCFTIPNFVLEKNPFIGFSAMTGDVADAHDIISVTTSAIILSAAGGSPRAQLTSPHFPSPSAWFTFRGLVKLIFFGAVSALAVAAARTYARQRGGIRVAGVDVMSRTGGLGTFARNSAKRF